MGLSKLRHVLGRSNLAVACLALCLASGAMPAFAQSESQVIRQPISLNSFAANSSERPKAAARARTGRQGPEVQGARRSVEQSVKRPGLKIGAPIRRESTAAQGRGVAHAGSKEPSRPDGSAALHAVPPPVPGPPVIVNAPDAASHQNLLELADSGQPDVASVIRSYCTNNGAAAADARSAWQATRIRELEGRLEHKATELAALMEDARAWVLKREAILTKAEDGIVAIYAKMRPEAAAQQLAAMDEALVVAILLKMNARGAGSILTEMNPEQAARLTKAMAERKSGILQGRPAT